VVSWNAIILGHVKCGQGQKGPELLCQIQLEGLWPDSVILVWILNACASILALKEGRFILRIFLELNVGPCDLLKLEDLQKTKGVKSCKT